ncbi:SDR family oxidoreductase [Paraburkholderia fynbosensis]|uniref:3-phenylpropionate-dihydrodiol/cinnamic acid-dihydrodiol dehydrogenase n=1 Tax=Paraburkholderia fynbosensis TaxID=1200993 RepID=A0A6J5H962_9BURK|nr:SDR family oxidoreductase [Paraburkholderia fynbosensis]CAB3810957.1 3-phenylpropionate-dihydrodiol/cinnamic acid-dihydrodiol dehydrogenase [Paraburkholderia fynbosensis]
MSQTVLITGCSSGFGRATVRAFLEAGWNVVATMRDTSGWSEKECPQNLLVVHLDVLDATTIESSLKSAIERFGQVDCLVNNAGLALFSVFEATPITVLRTLFETNVFGSMQTMQVVIPHFRTIGGGRIINISSGSAILPEPLMAAYSASKCAIEGLTESLQYELRSQNIFVKLIEPGFVPATNLVRKTAEQATSIPVPSGYQSLVDRTMAMYMLAPKLTLATEQDVAQAIVEAATDETEQLRYVVGDDAKESARMRRETSEQDYASWAKDRFRPVAP